ncbi:hypothetical protein COO60DRAFT_651496 [Scenedesmus sp. NREL 46B-D3]|nr:hypothetical protein COO60DRAFT_651496 [Scenedesmus sp. NREL 46B-D3]
MRGAAAVMQVSVLQCLMALCGCHVLAWKVGKCMAHSAASVTWNKADWRGCMQASRKQHKTYIYRMPAELAWNASKCVTNSAASTAGSAASKLQLLLGPQWLMTWRQQEQQPTTGVKETTTTVALVVVSAQQQVRSASGKFNSEAAAHTVVSCCSSCCWRPYC